jgi:hypothetical protein
LADVENAAHKARLERVAKAFAVLPPHDQTAQEKAR